MQTVSTVITPGNNRTRHYGQATIGLMDQGFVSAVNFLTVVILARYFSLVDFGIFMVAQTILLLLTGLQNTLVALPHNILGPQRTGLEYTRLTVVLGLLQLIFSCIVASIVAAIGGLLLLSERSGYAHLSLALAASVLPWMGQEFVRRVLYTQNDVAGAALNNIICYGLQLAGIVVVALQLGGVNASPANAMSVLGISSAIATVLGLWQLRRQLAPRIVAALPECRSLRAFKRSARDTWVVSKWPMAQQVVAWFGASGHGWILTAFLGPASFGIYRAAYQVVNILNPIRQTVMNHLPSRAARVFSAQASAGNENLAAWTKKTTWMLTIPFALGALAIALAAEPLAALMYGADLQLSNLKMIVVLGALAYTLNFARTPLDYAVLITGDGRALFLRALWLMAFVLTGGVALIWAFGVYGAMISEVVTAAIAGILTVRIYSARNAPKIDPAIFSAAASGGVQR